MFSPRCPTLAGLVLVAFLFPALAIDTVQVFPRSPAGNVAQYYPGVDTLWLGATMYTQVDGDSIFVQFVYGQALWANVLYFMNPVTGDTQRVFGFDEQGLSSGGRCPVNPVTGAVEDRKFIGVFPKNTELVFMLRTVKPSEWCGAQCCAMSCGPRYTGLNNPLKSTWYSSKAPYGGQTFAQLNDLPWAVMADMDSSQIRQLPPPCPSQMPVFTPIRRNFGVIFSFEDGDGLGGDFDDMIYLVLGAKLTPSIVRELKLNAYPQGPLCAGDSITINAEVWVDTTINGRDTTIRKTQYDPLVTWQLTGPSGNPPLRRGNGPSAQNVFYATEAYDTFTITATIQDPLHASVVLTSDITIPVNACYPHHISIEADSVVRNLRDDNPLGSVMIPSNQNTAVAYAFVRDQFGNYLGRADMAAWRAESTTIATAAATAGNPYRGIITRQRDGATRVIASQGTLIPDTIDVTVAAYRILKLRFVNTVTGQVVTAISMTTDDSVSLRLEGQKSNDTTQWVELRGNWTLSFPLVATSQAPTNGSLWTYSPTNAGDGTLSARYVDDQTVPAASVPVTITVAPPSRVSIQLLTPPEQRIAGRVIVAEVRIENTDGLVPGLWCFPGNDTGRAAYQDILMRPFDYPPVVTGEESDTLNLRPAVTRTVSQCFHGGLDTVQFRLYYAPQSIDSLHQLWVRLNGKTGPIEGSTERFLLLPGPVDSIYLADGQGTPLPPTQSLAAPTGILYAQSIGVDSYGNLIGPVSSGWTGGGTLHAPSPGPGSSLYYTTRDVTTAENGCIIAAASDNPAARDSVCLSIAAPPAYITAAITRDTSGNGLLDRIEVHFSKIVTIPDTLPLSNIVVNYRSRTTDVPLTVGDAIGRNGTTTDSVFYIELTESHKDLPQTGWLPSVEVVGVQDVQSAVVTCTDGAGPVIWKVTKDVTSADDHSKDIVTVTFSEDLDKAPGASDVPGVVFVTWVRSGPADFLNADTLLLGIDFFKVSSDDNQARFQMTNGKNLTGNNYLSIRVTPGAMPPVADNATPANAPNANNQRVQVLIANPRITVKAGPNPMSPTDWQPNDPSLQYRDPIQVAQWAYYHRGTAFLVSIPLPSDKGMTVEGELLVYDLAGNLVHRRTSSGDIVPRQWRDNWEPGSTQQFGVYWNGKNDRGMKVMPGAYRGLVKLTANYLDASGNRKTERISQIVAIGVGR